MNTLIRKIKILIPIRTFAYMQKPYHFMLAFLAAAWFWFPSRKLTVIGLTGTKGKTSTVELIASIFEAHGARVASVSSLRFRTAGKEEKNILGMTMPGRFFLQKFFSEAVKNGCRYAVIEVTSQGIEQYRHRFIDFDVGVFTNISPEHIEAHGGFEPYLRSKLDFFWRLKRGAVAVINRADAQSNRVAAACGCRTMWYDSKGIEYNKESFAMRNYHSGNTGIMFDIKGHQIKSPLRGDMNGDNIIAAVAVAIALRVPFIAISNGIANIKEISGRMQILQAAPFRVIVDYAHTPDSLERVYEILDSKNAASPSRLVCVLGAAGGGRDVWKRPELGKIAACYCRDIIITNEDPFDEEPEQIMEDIAIGVRQSEFNGTMRIIADRREAIRCALAAARQDDTVIITGKGSETYIRVADGGQIPWSDEDVVRKELAD